MMAFILKAYMLIANVINKKSDISLDVQWEQLSLKEQGKVQRLRHK